MYASIYQIGAYLASKGLGFGGLMNRSIRQFYQERQEASCPVPAPVKYWFHCASVGEYEMAAPLIGKLTSDLDPSQVLITFFSPSGYKQLSKDPVWGDRVMYLPLDERSAVRRFYRDYQPEVGVIVRYELWYNLLREGLRNNCKFYLINARFQKGHLLFGLLGKPYRHLLRRFEQVFTSDQPSADRLAAKGIERVSFTGDTRYDRMKEIQATARSFDRIAAFKGDRPLLILGSSYVTEESMLLDIMHDMPEIKIIVAPHQIAEERIIEIETLFSSFRPKTWSSPMLSSTDQLVIINNIGMLSSLYRYADIALVGGGFSGALHNIIEPLMWENLVLFGPNHDKYPEATGLLEAGLAREVLDAADLLKILQEAIDPVARQQHRARVREYVGKRLGASDKIAAVIS